MRGFFRWFLDILTTPLGVIILAALDSTIVFFLPLGIDAVVIILSARRTAFAWTVPLLATAGSLGGAAVTFWMGAKAGEKGLERYIPPRRLQRIRQRARDTGAIALASADLLPPPFPFTALLLTAGALEVSVTKFFTTLAICRLVRFGVEALLAVLYGPLLLTWFESDRVHDIVSIVVLLGIAISLFSFVRLLRPRSASRGAAA